MLGTVKKGSPIPGRFPWDFKGELGKLFFPHSLRISNLLQLEMLAGLPDGDYSIPYPGDFVYPQI